MTHFGRGFPDAKKRGLRISLNREGAFETKSADGFLQITGFGSYLFAMQQNR
jgi:hypothetical protein